MYASHPWLPAPPDPPPYSAQAQPATTTGTSQAYVLTLTTLPVPSGQSLVTSNARLTPIAIQYNGLPVYGPILQPSPPNSIPPSTPSVASLSIGTSQTPEQPRKPRVVFHMLNQAESVGRYQDNFFSPHNRASDSNELSPVGKQQCVNLKANFPYMKQVQYVFCSPNARTGYTAFQIFWEHLGKLKQKIIPWVDLRDCSSEDISAPVTTTSLFPFHCNSLSKSSYCHTTVPQLIPGDWQNDRMNLFEPDRADHVRLDLHNFARLAIDGGKWKGVVLQPYTGSGELHVVIVSHSNFLTRLTHRDTLPNAASTNVGFDNVQYRSYVFAPDDLVHSNKAQKYKLYETATSQLTKHVKDGAAASR